MLDKKMLFDKMMKLVRIARTFAPEILPDRNVFDPGGQGRFCFFLPTTKRVFIINHSKSNSYVRNIFNKSWV
mgnify:CR=1 FL=1